MMKNNAPKKILLAAVTFAAAFTAITFCFAQNAYSSSFIESEFELILPRQFQQSLIEQKWKTLATQKFAANWQFPDQVVSTQQGIQVHLDGISMAIQAQLNKPDLAQDQTNLELQSSDLQAQMVISSISVNQTVDQTVGGITGHFQIQAQCNNVVLNMKAGMGSFGISLKPAVAGAQVATDVQDVSLAWQAGAWEAQAFTCTGVQGFTDLVNQEIAKISADSNSFVTPLKSQIISYVKQYLGNFSLDLSKQRALVSSRSDVKMNMIIDSFDDTQTDQMTAKGRVTMEFTRSSNTGTTKLALSSQPATNISTTQASIRLPAGFAKEVMAQAYSANSWVQRLYSSSLPGFSTIMNSRLVQFFIWPELMNYSKSSKFLFDIYSNKDPKITGSGLQYQVGMNLLTKMQAPQNGNYVSFMNFVIPFSSKVNLAVSDSKLSVGFVNTSLDLQYQWDATYVNRYGSSQRFASSTIQSRILSAISGQTTTVALPTIPVMDGLSLNIKKAQSLSNSDLLLQLAP